jgi:hypothetical protein
MDYEKKAVEAVVQKIQAHIEAGGANEELTAATVLCSELLAAIRGKPTPPERKGCTCPNPALHAELAAPNPIDPAKCAPPPEPTHG